MTTKTIGKREMMRRFKTTEDLYGIDPKILTDMNYKEAIELKLSELHKRKIELATNLFKADGDEGYEQIVGFQVMLTAVNNAILYNEEMLEELR